MDYVSEQLGSINYELRRMRQELVAHWIHVPFPNRAECREIAPNRYWVLAHPSGRAVNEIDNQIGSERDHRLFADLAVAAWLCRGLIAAGTAAQRRGYNIAL